MGLILDFEGNAIDTMRDLMLVVADVVLTDDQDRGHALRFAYLDQDPDRADETLLYSVSRMFPEKQAHALGVLGLTPNVLKALPPAPLPASLQDAIKAGIESAHQYDEAG